MTGHTPSLHCVPTGQEHFFLFIQVDATNYPYYAILLLMNNYVILLGVVFFVKGHSAVGTW